MHIEVESVVQEFENAIEEYKEVLVDTALEAPTDLIVLSETVQGKPLCMTL